MTHYSRFVDKISFVLSMLVFIGVAALLVYVLYSNRTAEAEPAIEPPAKVYDLTVCRFGETGEKCVTYRTATIERCGPLFVQFEHDGAMHVVSGNGYDFSAVERTQPDTAATQSPASGRK